MSATPSKSVVVTAEQIASRVRELAGQVSKDYHGRTVYAVCVLENGFIFMADLVRALEVPVVCQFLKPEMHEFDHGGGTTTEIFYSPDVKVEGQHVLLVEGIVQSGITQDFLVRHMMARGAASVKLAMLLDKPAGRRVAIEAAYVGFSVGDEFVSGYGLGEPLLGRNLPHVSVVANAPAAVAR